MFMKLYLQQNPQKSQSIQKVQQSVPMFPKATGRHQKSPAPSWPRVGRGKPARTGKSSPWRMDRGGGEGGGRDQRASVGWA